MNHPGPERLRGKTTAGEIVIVTDFLGSGTRVSTMLDKFWAVPTVRSWKSRDMIQFRVVAAAAIPSALSKVVAIGCDRRWKPSGSLLLSNPPPTIEPCGLGHG